MSSTLQQALFKLLIHNWRMSADMSSAKLQEITLRQCAKDLEQALALDTEGRLDGGIPQGPMTLAEREEGTSSPLIPETAICRVCDQPLADHVLVTAQGARGMLRPNPEITLPPLFHYFELPQKPPADAKEWTCPKCGGDVLWCGHFTPVSAPAAPPERCPKCNTMIRHAPGIGAFCPNPACKVSDGPFNGSPETLPAQCLDCGLDYSKFPMDVILPRPQWLEIHPEDGGLLCAACIVKRAAKVPGATCLHAIIEIVPSRGQKLALEALNDSTLSDGAARCAARDILDPTEITAADVEWARLEIAKKEV